MMSVYSVDLCQNWAKRGTARSFTFAGVLRPNAVGEFTIAFPASGADIGTSDVATINSVIVWEQRENQSPRIVYAGIALPPSSADSGETGLTEEVAPEGVIYGLSGVDIFGCLNSRVTFPTTSQLPPWPDSHNTYTGVGSNIASDYIFFNYGDGALPERRASATPGVSVTFVDPAIGTSLTWTSRLQPLGSTVGSVCNATEIVCVASMPNVGELNYRFRQPLDVSEKVILMDEDGSGSARLRRGVSTGTYVVAGGSGMRSSATRTHRCTVYHFLDKPFDIALDVA